MIFSYFFHFNFAKVGKKSETAKGEACFFLLILFKTGARYKNIEQFEKRFTWL